MMYVDGETFEQIKEDGENFIPMFEPNYRDDEQRTTAEELCGDNLQCKFDFVVTNDQAVASATLENANSIENTNTNLGKNDATHI